MKKANDSAKTHAIAQRSYSTGPGKLDTVGYGVFAPRDDEVAEIVHFSSHKYFSERNATLP